MRKAWLPLPFLLLAALPVLADGAPEQAAVAKAPLPAHARLKQQLRAHGAEIARLQQEVTAQEWHSREASDHLHRQDREIARLQRQLEALSGRQQAAAKGH